jgi:hypothetical protein
VTDAVCGGHGLGATQGWLIDAGRAAGEKQVPSQSSCTRLTATPCNHLMAAKVMKPSGLVTTIRLIGGAGQAVLG